MLDERQITLVVTSAMVKYAAKNNGKRGLAKEDVISAVVSFGGDVDDVRVAMLEGVKRIASNHCVRLSWSWT